MFVYHEKAVNSSLDIFKKYLKVTLDDSYQETNVHRKICGHKVLDFYLDYKDQFFENNRYIVLYSGYVSGIDNTAESLLKNLIFKDNTLCFIEEVGGIYAAIIIDKHLSKSFSWSSSDNPAAIYYSEFGCVSTNPVFIFNLEPNSYPLNKDFVERNMSCGYMLNNETLFLKIYSLNNNDELLIFGEKLNIGRVCQSYSFYNTDNLNENVENFSNLLVESIKPLKNILTFGKSVELRVSGGKDSRTLLAAFEMANQDYSPIIYGQGIDDESRIANALVSTVGKKLLVTHPIFPTSYEQLLYNVDSMLLKMGGFIHVEARQSAYIYPKLSNYRNPIVLGHAHLQRGGFARTMSNDINVVKEKVSSYFLNKFVDEKTNSRNEAIIQDYCDSLLNKSHLEILYLVNKKYRVQKYLQSHYLYQFSQGIPFYPLIDSLVVNFLDQVPMFDKVSEKMVFNFINKSVPIFEMIPLASKRWRCDKIDMNGYTNRDPSNAINFDAPEKDKNLKRNLLNELSLNDEIFFNMFRYIKSSSYFGELYACLSPLGKTLFDNVSDLKSKTGVEKKMAMDFFWRCFILLRSVSFEWLKLLK